MKRMFGVASFAAICCLATACGDDTVVDPLPLVNPTSYADLFGSVLFQSNGSQVTVQSIENTAIVAIYFESTTCSACQQFTPQLISAYNELRLDGRSFEVVLVSWADNQDDMLAHMRDTGMPWLAVRNGGVVWGSLVQRYGVTGVPTLVVVDNDANTITMLGRNDIVSKGADAYDDWVVAGG